MLTVRVWVMSFMMVGSAVAQVMPIPGTEPVKPVFDRSDIVCNCTVDSLRTQSEHTSLRGGKPFVERRVRATLRVQETFKTTTPPPGKLIVEFVEEIPATRGDLPVPTMNETAVLFLKASGDIYVFADPFLGSVRFSSIPAQSGSTSGIDGLRASLSAVVEQGNEEDKLAALRMLRGWGNLDAETIKRVEFASTSSDPDIALSAMGVLFKIKQVETANSLSAYLQSSPPPSDSVALTSVGPEIGQIRDVKALPALESLASAQFLPVRLGAMDAMRGLRDPGSAHTLIQRLNDTNSTVRYLAVISLAEIFNMPGDYGPTMNLFDQRPDYYCQLWRQWWKEKKQPTD